MKRIAVLATVVAGLLSASGRVHAGTDEHVVTDRFSGLAIAGYDPVAYFADGTAQEGRADFELTEGGAVWRFRNDGNRAAFAARPDVYAPQYGGYDPIDVARGVARAGQPRIWLIVGRRLYLFGDAGNRDLFVAAHAAHARAAERAWPDVEKLLAR